MKAPTYNFEGSKPAAYCKQHAENGMVNVRSKRCLHDSCERQSGFNYKGCKTPAYCKQHAEEGMVSVRSQRCLQDSCRRGANFNIDNSKIPAYCKQHAAKGMVDICVTRSLIRSCEVVGAARGVPTDGEPTVGVRVKIERERLESLMTSVSTEGLCQTTGSLKRSTRGINGKHPPDCNDHAPLQGGLEVQSAAVEIAYSKEVSRSSSSLGPGTHLNGTNSDGGDGGTATKRTRLRLYHRPTPP